MFMRYNSSTHTDLTDEELIRLVQNGDEAAFAQLASRHSSRIWQLVVLNSRQTRDAEEIFQDVWIAVWENIRNLRKVESFGAWLRKIAYTACRRYYAAKVYTEGEILQTAEKLAETIDREALVRFREMELRTAVTEAVHHLPDRVRSVAVLYYLEMWTVKEIAEELNLAVGTVKTKLREIRARLRTEFGVEPAERGRTMSSKKETSAPSRDKTEFVHLHNHSEYSMLDGACRISDMVGWAVENNVPAVALTDHGNMFGAWEFYNKATAAGVNPIVGCEVYIASNARKARRNGPEEPYHLTLLAEDVTGYRNLLALVSLGYTEGLHHKPCIDMEILREHHEGIIALTGCIQGQVPQLLCADRRDEAVRSFKTLMEIMGKQNLYVEVQNHYIDKELEAYPVMAQLAKEFNLPLVGTNDCHYLHKSDHAIHDILLCIQTKKTVNDRDRLRFDNHFYFKSVDEMQVALKDYPPEAMSNTLEIANRCKLELDYGDSLMPQYEIPGGYTHDSYLRGLCYQGLREKYGELSEPMRQRVDHELGIIERTGYANYFLIVWDYVDYANTQGYPITARGSAAGSLVLHALNVVPFNPMDHDCLFERFMNLERMNPPDIDIDFSPRIREDVMNYLVRKYGEDSVSKVASFATLGAKAALTNVGRALEMPLESVRRLTALVPSSFKITLDEVLKQVPEFRELAELPENKELIEISKAVEGMKRYVSCHVSAIAVSDGPLTNYVPLFKDRHDQIGTQFEGKGIEEVGIVKFDSLGLQGFTETYDCLQMIEANHGVELKLEEIPFDDENTYTLVSSGLIAGLFQLDTSPGMLRVVTELKPENFEEFSAISALYRPGPIHNGAMQMFIDRKNGVEAVEYMHPSLEGILKSTYGICLYQEQLMQIACNMAGFTLGEADILRHAMGHNKRSLLKEQRGKFVDGAIKNGIVKQAAENVFDRLEPVGSYAFNKAHAVAYSMLAYRMAYLKTHYPQEFMAAVMRGATGDSTKSAHYQSECEKLSDFLGVEMDLLPPV